MATITVIDITKYFIVRFPSIRAATELNIIATEANIPTVDFCENPACRSLSRARR